jgi:hypothetical protein
VLTVPPLFDVSGRVEVVDSSGQLLTVVPAQVRIMFRNPNQSTTIGIGIRGTFSSTLGEGEYELTVDDLPSAYKVRSITSGLLDLTKDRLRLSDGMPEPERIRIVLISSQA